MRDYYKILGVKSTASADKIKKAYEEIANDPQKSRDQDAMARRRAAYEILSDPRKREQYDSLANNRAYLRKLIYVLQEQTENAGAAKQAILNVSVFTCLNTLCKKFEERSYTLTDDEERYMLDKTIKLMTDLAAASDEDCQQLLLNYGKEIRTLFQGVSVFCLKYENMQLAPLKLINDLLVNSLGYGLVELELFELDKEIKRVETLAKEIHPTYQNKFVDLLKEHKNKIRKDLQTQCENQKNWAWGNEAISATIEEVTNSTGFQLITDTTETLQKLRYSQESKADDKHHLLEFAAKYEQKAKETPHVKNFMKSIAAVVTAGLSCILSIPFSIVGFFCVGPYCAAVPLDAAVYGRDAGKKLTGLPANVSLSQHFLFKNIAADAAKTAKKGADLIDPSVQQTAETNANQIRAEYFALKG